MTFVAIFYYVVSIVLTAGGLALLLDGRIPSHGFIAVMCSFIMAPELFWMIPHCSESADKNEPRTPWLFRLGASPSTSLFILAALLGFLQASVTYFLFRTFTTTMEWKPPNIACGAVVVLLLIVLGAILADSIAVANRLAGTGDADDARVKPRRKG